jgi:digeranylgeranylglycerophospholipid reductase
MKDAIIIGAGPAGLHLAYRLSEAGIDVAVIDAQTRIGEGAVCSGVIGEEAFGRFELPTRSVLARIHSIRAVSPAGKTLDHQSPVPLARVVEKGAFNQDLASLSLSTGVEFYLGRYVESLRPEMRCVAANYRSRCGARGTLKARVAIIASGVNSTLNRRLGLARPCEFLRAAQADIVIGKDGAAHPTKVYFGRRVAPGGFGWRIPLGQGHFRVGLLSTANPRPYFVELLRKIAPEIPASSVPVSQKAIGQVPRGKSVAERLLVIGEAAGHIKTSTGGGIYYGLLSAEFASEVLLQAFRRGQFSTHTLGRFERYWRSAFGSEILIGHFARRLAALCPDDLIERIFEKASAIALIAKLNGSLKFDWHQRAILETIRALFGFSSDGNPIQT